VIEGLSHVTFVVRDLDRTSDFLSKIFDAEEIYTSGDATFSISREKFFLIGGVWVAIMEGPSLPERTYNHVAFKISEDDFDAYADRLRSMDVRLRESRGRVEEEGRSLYL
jgi:catechol 2,3-dioxygenase-like lactoylglutathione lyase family enzyme